MAQEYPPVAFYFKLSFSGSFGSVDTFFKEVSGISMEMGIEEIAEAGNSTFKHRVPTSMKFSNLILKRGLVESNSELMSWCNDVLTSDLSETIKSKNILVSLLNENGNPIITWSFMNAWPVNCSVANLNLANNEVLIETLEFAYSSFTQLVN